MNKIICMIPARIGSQRFKTKNLALIEKKPLLSWGIEAAINSNIFDEIIVNGDSHLFNEIAKSYGLNYLDRNKSLSTSQSRSDDVVYDFLKHFDCKYIIWFNAIAPLQTKKDINGFIKMLISNNLSSLFSVKTEFIQTLFKEKSLNFSINEKFARTQDLDPIKTFVPSLMGWDSDIFIKNYQEKNFSFFSEKTGFYEIKSRLSSLVVKTENDFRLIRSVIEGFSSYNKEVEYYSSSTNEQNRP